MNMNKTQFLALLHSQLSALPPEECNELMEDYEAHFSFALQNGRTEEDVILELGNPYELAKEALGQRYQESPPVYWTQPDRIISPSQSHVTPKNNRRGWGTTIIICIGLFFVDIIVVPALISLWAAWVSLVTFAFALLVSPLALGMEYVWNHEFMPAKAFAVLAMVGIGIFLAISCKGTFRAILRLNRSFGAWHIRTVRGGRV